MSKILAPLFALTALCAGMPAFAAQPAVAAAAAPVACPAILKQTFNRLQDEAPQNLCQYAGKVVLVVNTASYCGFTKQYEGLEALYAKYGSKGLVVLGFPSNDFGNQEPGKARISPTCATTPTASNSRCLPSRWCPARRRIRSTRT